MMVPQQQMEAQEKLFLKICQNDILVTKFKRIKALTLHLYNFVQMLISAITQSQYFNGIAEIVDPPNYLDMNQEIKTKVLYKYRLHVGNVQLSQNDANRIKYIYEKQIQKVHALVQTHLLTYELKKDFISMKKTFQIGLREQLAQLQKQILIEEQNSCGIFSTKQSSDMNEQK